MKPFHVQSPLEIEVLQDAPIIGRAAKPLRGQNIAFRTIFIRLNVKIFAGRLAVAKYYRLTWLVVRIRSPVRGFANFLLLESAEVDVDSCPTSERVAPKRLRRLLDDLNSGQHELLSSLIELYRPYLLAAANARLEDRLQAKAGPSDLAQEAIVAANHAWGELTDQPQTEEELRKWLRGILMERLKALRRRFYRAQRRSLALERSFEISDSRQLLDQIAESVSESPSTCLDRKLLGDELELALKRLSPAYRQVIVWRNRDDWSFADIGRRMDRSEDAARMLWRRAIQQLKKELRMHRSDD